MTNEYDKICCVFIFVATQENDTSTRSSTHYANCQRSDRAPSWIRTIFTYSIVLNVFFYYHVSSGQNDLNWSQHSKERMEIFVSYVHKLVRHQSTDKIDEMSAGGCQKSRKYGSTESLVLISAIPSMKFFATFRVCIVLTNLCIWIRETRSVLWRHVHMQWFSWSFGHATWKH